MDKDEIITTAKERFEYALERSAHNREKMRDDIRFAAASPDDPWQWEKNDQVARKGRPMLTINKMPQHIRQVTNDIRQNRPSIRFRPADDNADPEVADILMGLVKHIEANSDADVAYDTAAECQVVHGLGYIRVLTDYIRPDSFDQDIFIGRIKDPFKCYDDPDIQDPAGADRRFFFIEEKLKEDEFKEQYPDAEVIDWTFSKDEGWFTGEKEVRVVEYFELLNKDSTLFMWANGSTSYKGDKLPAGVIEGEKPVKQRQAKKSVVMWRKLNGQEVLEEREFPCSYIPVARVVGNEWEVDGKSYISGIVRNAKDSQRMYNVAQSAIVERVMKSPNTPWTVPAEAVEGYEKEWQSANSANHAYLPYNHVDEAGNPIPGPVRTQPAMVETGLNQIAMGASDDIKAETGQYDASLGQKSNETSGRAIMARQREGDTATFHYVDNLARAVRHVGRIILDMIPRIYDTQRIALILGEDESQSNVTIDPNNPEAMTEYRDEMGEIKRIFNPNIGTYDIYTTTGPSFTTRRVEAVDAMTTMTQANPQLWQVIGDLLVKNMDWPGAEEMADRLKLTLLPAVQQDISKDEGAPEVPPQVQQAMAQMQDQVGQLDHVIQKMQEELDKAEQEKGAAVLAAQRAQSETMSLKLEMQKRDALEEIEEAQEASEEQGESPDLELIKQHQMDERERDKMIFQQDTELKKTALTVAGQIEIARINALGAPEADVAGQESNDIMQRLMETHSALLNHIATPKTAQISIIKNPDGSFSGQRIEQ
mgnify:CR=1 FL=1